MPSEYKNPTFDHYLDASMCAITEFLMMKDDTLTSIIAKSSLNHFSVADLIPLRFKLAEKPRSIGNESGEGVKLKLCTQLYASLKDTENELKEPITKIYNILSGTDDMSSVADRCDRMRDTEKCR